MRSAWLFGQLDLSGKPSDSVPSLHAGPFYEVWTLESPWPLCVLLVIAGLTAAWFLNQRGKQRRALMVGGGLILAAGVLLLVAHFVTTTREALRARTRELIGAVARGETAQLNQLLANDATVLTSGQPWIEGRQAILEGVQRTTGGPYKVRRSVVLEEQQQIDQKHYAQTQVWVRIEGDGFFGRSWWRLAWRHEDPAKSIDDWKVVSIDLLDIDGMEPQSLRSVGP
ncbi:MAG TPA: hypothetical protein PL072_01385 [Phycisphaerales bacterium]|nr:hypothetical protein [Phycisphaerales bacterium]